MAPKRKAKHTSETKQSEKFPQKKDNIQRSDSEPSRNGKSLYIRQSQNSCNASGVPSGKKCKIDNHGKDNHKSGVTILSLFRQQQENDKKTVKCPVCQRNVFYHKINQHLDENCSEKYVASSCGNISGRKGVVSNDNDKKHGLTRVHGDTCSGSPLSVRNTNGYSGILVNHGNSSVKTGAPKLAVGSESKGKRNNGDLQSNDEFLGTFTASTSVRSNYDQAAAITTTEYIDLSDETIGHIPINDKQSIQSSNCQRKIASHMSDDNAHKISTNNAYCNLYDGKNEVDEELQDMSTIKTNNIQTQTSDHISKTQKVSESSNEVDAPIHEPYYLSNFNLTIKTVLSDKDDQKLFNEDDKQVVKLFQDLTEGSKKLYVRLFQRKFKWFQTSKIQYPNIGENLEKFFQELIDYGFLQSEDGLCDLEEILKLLPASDIQEVAKSMHIVKKNEGKSKKDIIQLLINHGKKQCSLFANNGDRISKAIVKRSKALLGSCVKLATFPRNVFSRIIVLFSLNLLADDDDNAGSQLSALFLINIGKVVYPSYEISKEIPLFCCRDELIKYREACEDMWRMEDLMENKKFDEASHVYNKVKLQFNKAICDLVNKEQTLVYSVNLPTHLRRFTCTWVYTRVCSRGVELLQRDKKYGEAVELLQQLLGQDKFCVTRRGWWWERLALNLDQHLKKPAEALNAVLQGLSDGCVRTGHRFALEQRAKKICESKRNKSLHHHLEEIKFTELKQPEVVTICGRRLANEPVFVLHEVNSDGSVDGDVVSYCGVEEMALRHYRQHGYNQGLHGEGATFNTLFGLLMWNIIFASGIPDVFRTSFQMAPLDIYCDNFYENRKEMICQRLDEIRGASKQELSSWIESAWIEHNGKTCVGISWDLFTGVEQIKELSCCLGGRVLAGICEQFARDYRHTRSGLPDLVVWNSSTFQYKIVEVKGPNDRLSTKQHVWLDVLVNLGVEAVVLYVKAIGGRKIS